jgi:hypothetical protein
MAAVRVLASIVPTLYTPMTSSWSVSVSSTQRMQTMNCSLFTMSVHKKNTLNNASTYLSEDAEGHDLQTFILAVT